MSGIRKVAIFATIAVALGALLFQYYRGRQLESQVRILQEGGTPLTNQLAQLQHERDDATNRAARLTAEIEQLRGNQSEVLRLRAELTRLRGVSHELEQVKAAKPAAQADSGSIAWTDRANQLKQWLEQMPDRKIPELQLLKDVDWLDVTKSNTLGTEEDARKGLRDLRTIAKGRFGNFMAHALDKFTQANNGLLPSDPAQLQPYFEQPVDSSMFERYQMLYTGKLSDVPSGEQGRWIITEKAPVDTDYDSHLYIGPNTTRTVTTGINQAGDPWSTPR